MRHSEIENRFTFHPATPEKAEKYEGIRNEARQLAHILNELCPDGRELSIAMTKLDEVVMFANASIARNE
ncbi:hypothetical protein FZC84_21185 [Rossellomorea vietnamensis]|uniref:Acb2/Tad1 hairpin domain-containing protein n=1 Tax=Rossellomorea vietnamensis TaxID=218284 RepID=A0A5D4M1L8_9BACI|nr:hypothetical protein [Rossellomorea vietnamensis]TYR95709.1 hypothetical protein FZC84_21185 [Rossellomorea vietnamensis]